MPVYTDEPVDCIGSVTGTRRPWKIHSDHVGPLSLRMTSPLGVDVQVCTAGTFNTADGFDGMTADAGDGTQEMIVTAWPRSIEGRTWTFTLTGAAD